MISFPSPVDVVVRVSGSVVSVVVFSFAVGSVVVVIVGSSFGGVGVESGGAASTVISPVLPLGFDDVV